MRSTRFTSLKLATCLALGLIVSSTGCKMPWGSSSSWSPSSLVWNPMKMWKSDAPPPASSLAATSKPSTQIPTPGPTGSVGARTATTPAANNWATAAPPVHTSNGYGGATANATASTYPGTAHANGYPTQPATSYGSPNQPGQVAPAAGYGAGQYGMTASPAGGAAAGGYQPTYTASAQPAYQTNPYSTSTQPAAGGYQSPAAGGYQAPAAGGYQPTYNTPAYTPPADNGGGYNTGAYNPAYSQPSGGYQQPAYSQPAAQPASGGYNPSSYQGGYNTGASTQEPAAANNYAAANNGYDAAPAAAASSATPAAGNYATAYTQPTDANRPATGMEVSGVTTGSPAVPASLATIGGYRPGSTGRTVDNGVQNAAYSQPSNGTGYNGSSTLYR